MNEFLDLAKDALKEIHQIQLNALKSKYIKLQGETLKEKEEKKGEK